MTNSPIPPLPQFPAARPRRLRQTDWTRRLVAENSLSANDLIWPIFVHDAKANIPIPSMPGVERLTIESAVAAAREAEALGIPAIALFIVIVLIQRWLKNIEGGHQNEDLFG